MMSVNRLRLKASAVKAVMSPNEYGMDPVKEFKSNQNRSVPTRPPVMSSKEPYHSTY